MPTDATNPGMLSYIFDASEFLEYSCDLSPEECQGKLAERDGNAEVCNEIIDNQPYWGSKAGISPDDITQLQLLNGRIARLDAFLPPMEKCCEVLRETRMELVDQRERLIYNAANSVDRRAIKDPSLLARYQRTRAYRSAAALKAAKTRKKKAVAGKPAPSATPAPSAPSAYFAHRDHLVRGIVITSFGAS